MYNDKLIIEKKGYKHDSYLRNDNIIYDVVNNISSVPYKINIEVLNYLYDKGFEQGLLMDTNIEHKYSGIESNKLSIYKKKQLYSYISKRILQENILGIADFFTNFTQIYFPVRLDQRGRLYCISSYFNYQ